MEDKKIEIEAEMTFDDFFYTIVSRSFNVRWIFVIAALIVIIPLAVFSILMFYVKGEWIVTFVILGLPVLIFSYLFYYFYRAAKKLATKSKSKIRWSFSDSGYDVFSEIGTATVSWKGIEEVIEIKNHFLMVIQNPLYFIIPKRCFNDSQIVEFRELIRRKLGDKAKLKG
jgi:YcxB-like protein